MVTSEKETAESVVSVDMGNLTAFDPRPLDPNDLRGSGGGGGINNAAAKCRSDHLKSICTTATQLLIARLFELPVERVEDVLVAKLPTPETVLPREKPVPKAKPLTKWQQYAKMKGITKTKKSRMLYEEASGEWKPRWGYKRAGDSTKDWLIEIKKNEDPNQDFFAKRTNEKNERVAKNELQRLRNIARASKGKVPGVGLTPTVVESTTDKIKIKRQLNLAKKSDASLSKFSEKLNGEEKITKGLGKKRKFEANFKDLSSEKNSQLKILESITTKKDKSTKEKINSEKSVNKHIANENNHESGKPKYKKRRSLAGGHKNRFKKRK